jgi:hypothetical protein
MLVARRAAPRRAAAAPLVPELEHRKERLLRHLDAADLLARDLRFELLGQRAADLVGLVAMDDHRQRVDLLADEQEVELSDRTAAHERGKLLGFNDLLAGLTGAGLRCSAASR